MGVPQECSPLFDRDTVTSFSVIDGGEVEGTRDVSVGVSET